MSDHFKIKPMSELPQDTAGTLLKVAKFARTSGYPHVKAGAMIADTRGHVYYTGHKFDIREESADARRAFCRLTGMRNKDMDQAVALFRQEQRKQVTEAEIESLREDALLLGYDIVKLENKDA